MKPSRLAALAGVEIAEIEPLNHNGTTPMQCTIQSTGVVSHAAFTAGVTVWREGLQIPNGSRAEPLWRYTDSFFGNEGYVAATRLQMPQPAKNEVIYIGAGIDPEALVSLATATLEAQGVVRAGVGATPEVEQMLRTDLDGKVMRVAINHGADAAPAAHLAAFEVRISSEPKGAPARDDYV